MIPLRILYDNGRNWGRKTSSLRAALREKKLYKMKRRSEIRHHARGSSTLWWFCRSQQRSCHWPREFGLMRGWFGLGARHRTCSSMWQIADQLTVRVKREQFSLGTT
jgi:hypothetical protein